jgi:copper chaperone
VAVEQIELRVSGTSCTGCEQRIQNALSGVPGVGRSAADHRVGQVRVLFDPARTSEQSVRACIMQAGYGVLP